MGAYAYYFRKPKSEIVKDIFMWLLVGGVIAIAATSPYFVPNLVKGYKRWKKYPAKKVSDTFYQLRKKGLIHFETTNQQLYISLTKEGVKRAGMFQIDKLKVKKPKQWDGFWRILMFDIEEKKKPYREALRGKLKELGFFLLQKSVWAHPFNCRNEVELLKSFFGLSSKELCLIVAKDVSNEGELKAHFHLS